MTFGTRDTGAVRLLPKGIFPDDVPHLVCRTGQMGSGVSILHRDSELGDYPTWPRSRKDVP